jgi:DMSO/TMAO reductase YedYZ molybdopterin-dependent catalytic subunit
LEIGGLVQGPAVFTLDELKSWPMASVDARLTSVSGWSVRAVWQGVLWSEFLNHVSLQEKASHATFISLGGGYRTTISLEDLDHPRVIMAYAVADEPLEFEYGGPLRMVVPHLWGYKSAKWLGLIEFTDTMVGGYWEDRGYTRSGRIEPGSTLDLNTGKRRTIQGGEVTDF